VEQPVVVVTGGASGIGASTALAFARLGGHVVLCDLSATAAEQVAERVFEVGGEAVVVVADVRDPVAMRTLGKEAARRFGRVDCLVTSAGIADQSTVSDGDPARWRLVVETNLLGVLYTVRGVLPHMLERGAGHVFLIASVSGRETYVGEPVHIATKWGVVGFGHALRHEVADNGVRVTLVEPGVVDTPLTRDNPALRPLLETTKPLSPEDVAGAIVYSWQQSPHVVVSELTIRPLRPAGTPAFGDAPKATS